MYFLNLPKYLIENLNDFGYKKNCRLIFICMSKLGAQSFTPLNSVTLVCFDGDLLLYSVIMDLMK